MPKFPIEETTIPFIPATNRYDIFLKLSITPSAGRIAANKEMLLQDTGKEATDKGKDATDKGKDATDKGKDATDASAQQLSFEPGLRLETRDGVDMVSVIEPVDVSGDPFARLQASLLNTLLRQRGDIF
jgi:hypothetical protein